MLFSACKPNCGAEFKIIYYQIGIWILLNCMWKFYCGISSDKFLISPPAIAPFLPFSSPRSSIFVLVMKSVYVAWMLMINMKQLEVYCWANFYSVPSQTLECV